MVVAVAWPWWRVPNPPFHRGRGAETASEPLRAGSGRGVQLHSQFPVNLKRGGGRGGHTRGTHTGDTPSRPLGAGAGSITPQPSPARPPSLQTSSGLRFGGDLPPFSPSHPLPPHPPAPFQRLGRRRGPRAGKVGLGARESPFPAGAGAAGWARSSVPGERSASPGSLPWRSRWQGEHAQPALGLG